MGIGGSYSLKSDNINKLSPKRHLHAEKETLTSRLLKLHPINIGALNKNFTEKSIAYNDTTLCLYKYHKAYLDK